jgi:hypothetical protein
MTEPQSWTLILGVLTTVAALLSLMTMWVSRTIRTEVGSLRSEMRSEIGSVRTEMRTEFRRIDERFDHLDRDVQALTRHVFGRPE